jgi:hypothetical protein
VEMRNGPFPDFRRRRLTRASEASEHGVDSFQHGLCLEKEAVSDGPNCCGRHVFIGGLLGINGT